MGWQSFETRLCVLGLFCSVGACYGSVEQDPLNVREVGPLEGFEQATLILGNAAAIYPIANDGLLVQTIATEGERGTGALLLISGGAEPAPVVQPSGSILSVVNYLNEVLVLTSTGVFVLDEQTLIFEDAGFDAVPENVSGMWVQSGGVPALWFLGDTEITLFFDAAVQQIRLPGVSLQEALLMPKAGDLVGAWIYADRKLFSVTLEQGALKATTHRVFNEGGVRALHVDRGGSLWLERGDDALERTSIGSWTTWLMPAPLLGIAAHERSALVWFVLEDSVLQYRAGKFYRAGGVDLRAMPTQDLGLIAAGEFGTFYFSKGGDVPGVISLSALRTLALRDPEFSDVLNAPVLNSVRSVGLEVPFAALVSTIEVTWAGVLQRSSVELSRVILNPWTLPETAEAEFDLNITVRYQDGARPLEGQWRVARTAEALIAPTWADSIQAISKRSCDQCHGPSAPARPLFTKEHWKAEFEAPDRLALLDNGTMPIGKPPLPALEMALLDAWRLAGFP